MGALNLVSALVQCCHPASGVHGWPQARPGRVGGGSKGSNATVHGLPLPAPTQAQVHVELRSESGNEKSVLDAILKLLQRPAEYTRQHAGVAVLAGRPGRRRH